MSIVLCYVMLIMLIFGTWSQYSTLMLTLLL